MSKYCPDGINVGTKHEAIAFTVLIGTITNPTSLGASLAYFNAIFSRACREDFPVSPSKYCVETLKFKPLTVAEDNGEFKGDRRRVVNRLLPMALF